MQVETSNASGLERFLRVDAVMEVTGMPLSTLYLRVSQKAFPRSGPAG